MLAIFVLLVALPLGALCQSKEQALMMIELMYKPCILHNRNCPRDGSMDYDKYAALVSNMAAMRPPKECQCDRSSESCTRRCYYAYVKNAYMKAATYGKSPAEAEEAKRQYTLILEYAYKPCILENRNCESAGNLNYQKISTEVNNFTKFTLPSECDCDLESEGCVRLCYYSFVKQQVLSAPSN